MLTEAGHQIVISMKIPGFGAYLQNAYMDSHEWESTNQSDKLPNNIFIEEIHKTMQTMKNFFDAKYLSSNKELHVLESEKEAWLFLSRCIDNFLERLKNFLEQSNDVHQDQSELSKQLCSEFCELLQQWKVISNAYKNKYERCYDKNSRSLEALLELIGHLRTAAKTACAAQDGSVLRSDEGRHPSPKSPNG